MVSTILLSLLHCYADDTNRYSPVEFEFDVRMAVAYAIFLVAGIWHSSIFEWLVCQIIFMNIKPPKKPSNSNSVNQFVVRCALRKLVSRDYMTSVSLS
jgi:hypothetical protein